VLSEPLPDSSWHSLTLALPPLGMLLFKLERPEALPESVAAKRPEETNRPHAETERGGKN